MISLIWIFFIGWASTDRVRFERLTVEDGLSQVVVQDVCQDKTGYIWVGTQDGLNRYDGYQFLVFRNTAEDKRSLSDNFVLDLFEDHLGVLWVGTYGGGLNRYHPSSRDFTRYQNDPTDSKTIASNSILRIAEDNLGRIWLGTLESGVSRLGPGRDVLDHLLMDTSGVAGDRNRVYAILCDREGRLWVGGNGGLFLWDEASERFAPMSLGSQSNAVRDIAQDRDGLIWVATWGQGIMRLGPDGDVTPFTAESGLSDDHVFRMVIERDQLWAATYHGLSRLQFENESWRQYHHNPADGHSLSHDFLLGLAQDRSGVLWIGTSGGGLSKLSQTAATVVNYSHDPIDQNSLSDSIVFSVYDEPEALWVGTFSHGLNRIDRQTNVVQRIQHREGDPSSLGHNQVNAILRDSRGVLWVGTRRGGLDRMKPDGSGFVHYRKGGEGQISGNEVMDIVEDDSGRLWIATWDGGVNRYRSKSDDFLSYRADMRVSTSGISISSDVVNCLSADPNGGIWIGTQGHGVDYLREDQVFRFVNNPNDASSLTVDVINSIHVFSNGDVWIGTNGGLNRLQWAPGQEPRFKRIRLKDGLQNETINGILEGEGGIVWASNNHGIARIDPSNWEIVHFDVSNGVPDNEFNVGACFKNLEGQLMFGSIGGLCVFMPSQLTKNDHIPPVVLTSVKRFNRVFELQTAFEELKELTLGHADSVISFEFSALDFNHPARNRYAYMLEGFDTQWIDLGGKHDVTFTNLDSGDYVLRIKGSNNNGVWNMDGIHLPIKVIPPIWQTWPAYLLYAFVLVLVLISLPMMRIRQLQKTRSLLSTLVDEKTRALTKTNEQLVNQNLELETLNDIVKAINRKESLDELYATLISQSMVLCPQAETAVLFVVDEQTGDFRNVAWSGLQLRDDVAIDAQQAVDRYTVGGQQVDEGIVLFNGFDKVVGKTPVNGIPMPRALIAMTLVVDERMVGFLTLGHHTQSDAFKQTDARRVRRLREHVISAFSKSKTLGALKATADRLRQTQNELARTAHLAGKAEMAADVLHSAGNALNSLNVSLDIMRENLRSERVFELFDMVVELIHRHRSDLARFLDEDPRGQRVPEILEKIGEVIRSTHYTASAEMKRLDDKIDEIRCIVSSQSEMASQMEALVACDIGELVRDALAIHGPELEKEHVQVEAQLFSAVGLIRRQVATQIIIELLGNAIRALSDTQGKHIFMAMNREDAGYVSLVIKDNGHGVEPRYLSEIFRYGFSTHPARRGNGLHHAANALHEMGGWIRAKSRGPGHGSCFTLGFADESAVLNANPE